LRAFRAWASGDVETDSQAISLLLNDYSGFFSELELAGLEPDAGFAA